MEKQKSHTIYRTLSKQRDMNIIKSEGIVIKKTDVGEADVVLKVFTKEFGKIDIYVNGISAPRGRILDTNGKVLVDNIGVKTIYYNKIKGIKISEELKIAEFLEDILEVKEASVDELKKYYLTTNDNGKNLITKEEYRLLEERKLNKDDINKMKLERITDDLIDYDTKTKRVAHIYYLMNNGTS